MPFCLDGGTDVTSTTDTALVTGASGGIGVAICAAFKQAGYSVIATDVVNNGNVACDRFVVADLRELCNAPRQLKAFYERANIGPHGLKVLVNNAATQVLGRTEQVTTDDWRVTLDVNLVAPFLLTQLFLGDLERARGSVINIGSVHAKATKPGFVCYATSKAGLAGLTRSMAVDLGARIRVNSVNPAAVNTPMLMDGFRNGPEKLQLLARMHPLDRIAEPSEVANVALFLASDRASFMSGASIDVDGGILARLHDPD